MKPSWITVWEDGYCSIIRWNRIRWYAHNYTLDDRQWQRLKRLLNVIAEIKYIGEFIVDQKRPELKMRIYYIAGGTR